MGSHQNNNFYFTRILYIFKGNDANKRRDNIGYPTEHDDVICVGGHDTNCDLSPGSTRGDKVDFLCPGVNVASNSSNWKGGWLDEGLGDYHIFFLTGREIYLTLHKNVSRVIPVWNSFVNDYFVEDLLNLTMRNFSNGRVIEHLLMVKLSKMCNG